MRLPQTGKRWRPTGITLTEAVVAMGIFAVVSSIGVEMYLHTRRAMRREANRSRAVASELAIVAMIRRDAMPAYRVLHRLGAFRSDFRTLIIEAPASSQSPRKGAPGRRYVVYHPSEGDREALVRSVYASIEAKEPLETEVVADGIGPIRFEYDAPEPEDARVVRVAFETPGSGRREQPPTTYATAFHLRNARCGLR
ncbi:MAG: type II secretion system protein J [Armatimonadota bacterium]